MPGELRFHRITLDDRAQTAQAPGESLDRTFSLYGGLLVVSLGIVAFPIFVFVPPSVWRLRFKVLELRWVADVRMWFGSGAFEHSCVCSLSRTPECGGDSGTHDQ